MSDTAFRLASFLNEHGGEVNATRLVAFYELAGEAARAEIQGAKFSGQPKGIRSFCASHPDLQYRATSSGLYICTAGANDDDVSRLCARVSALEVGSGR